VTGCRTAAPAGRPAVPRRCRAAGSCQHSVRRSCPPLRSVRPWSSTSSTDWPDPIGGRNPAQVIARRSVGVRLPGIHSAPTVRSGSLSRDRPGRRWLRCPPSVVEPQDQAASWWSCPRRSGRGPGDQAGLDRAWSGVDSTGSAEHLVSPPTRSSFHDSGHHSDDEVGDRALPSALGCSGAGLPGSGNRLRRLHRPRTLRPGMGARGWLRQPAPTHSRCPRRPRT